ncbi:MAG: hypothetical protein O3A55_06435 [Bacteroidetes bacterium]|nr:hypothetical protein [Bacteroidota bacterium]
MSEKNLTGLAWGWIIFGSLIGTILTFLNIWLMAAYVGSFDNPQSLFALFSLMLTGIFIAYKSPSSTIYEPAISGSIAIILTLLLLNLFTGVSYNASQILLTQALAFQLSMLGGWVGEHLQSGERTKSLDNSFKFQWAWSVAASVLAFILSLSLFYISVAALKSSNIMTISALQLSEMLSFGVGFFAAGYFIGFRSPGKTIIEAGVGGLFGFCFIIGFWVVQREDSFTLETSDYYSLVFAFAMVLLGSWVGEFSEKNLSKNK